MKKHINQVFHRRTIIQQVQVFRPSDRQHMKTEIALSLLSLFLWITFATPVLAQYTPADWPGAAGGTNASLPWVPMRTSTGGLIQDVNTEAIADEFNITFNSAPNDASAYLAYDQSTATCFFRLQLFDSPWDPSKSALDNGFWIVQLGDSTSTSASDPRGAIVLNGNGEDVRVVNGWAQNAVPTVIYSVTGTPTVWTDTYAISTVTGTTTTYYLDYQVPMAALTTYLGITASTDLRFYFGTSQANGTTGSINKDYMLGSASSVDFTGVEFGEMTSISGGALPVELSSFTAHVRDGLAQLKWRTATELNNYGFEVQRSVRSEEWEAIGFVQGNGTSYSPQEYRYDDPISVGCSEAIRYRLRQIDRDGSEEYSPIVLAHPAEPTNFGITEVFPNPFNPSATLSFTLTENVDVSLHLHDMIGSRVMTVMENVLHEIGSHSLMLQSDNLPSGRYFAVLRAGSQSSIYPIVLSR